MRTVSKVSYYAMHATMMSVLYTGRDGDDPVRRAYPIESKQARAIVKCINDTPCSVDGMPGMTVFWPEDNPGDVRVSAFLP